MWITGVSMALSLSGEQRKGSTRVALTFKVVLRSVKLGMLGLFLNNGHDWYNWRVPGT